MSFNILNNQNAQKQTNSPAEAEQLYKELIGNSDIFVFMKGTPDAPQCGFSYNTCKIFQTLGKEFKSFNILQDPIMRDQIKFLSNWPTYPQVYFKGKLMGGNDIVTEMFENGELAELTKDVKNI